MALIDCPECGRDVSSNAAACPECAYPLAGGVTAAVRPTTSEPPKDAWWKTAFPIVLRLFIGAMLIGIGLDEGETTGVIGGLIIGGSAIPTWYRYKIDRLRAGRSGAELGARLDDRIREIEMRHREQMEQIERTHTGQIADLEERIDFAERLLTKQRD